jgi:VWFA-related protein
MNMIRGCRHPFAAIGITLLFGFAASLSGSPHQASRAQSKPPQTKPSSESLRHEVTVSLKLVQVHVLNPYGKPALDLEQSDFVVLDNGKPQTITAFEKHFVPLPETKLGETKPLPARNTVSVLNRKFIFLIDFDSNNVEGVTKSVIAAREFLDTKTQSGDEIAIFSSSWMRGLVLHEYFTADIKKIRTTLGKVLDTPVVTEGWNSFAAMGHSLMGMETLDPQAKVGAGLQQRSASARLSEGLVELSKALRHIPGKKNIILFSRGFGRGVQMPGSLAERDFKAMGQALASADSPVFTVDSTAGFEAKAAKSVLPEYSLQRLSEITGGKFFPDISRYAEIAEGIQSVTGNYYVLGYSIAAAWDGKFHDIKVEVKRKGYKTYAQQGYYNPQPFSMLTPIEKHLHLLELALGEKASTDLRLDFPVLALPFSEKKDAPNVLMLSQIPVRRIVREIGAKTEFISLVFDRDKVLAASRRMEMDWAEFRGESLAQYSAEVLAPGPYECRIILRNTETGLAAVAACSVVIPEPTDASLRIFPPLLLCPGPEMPFLNVAGPKTGGAASDMRIDQIYPFPSKGLTPVIGELRPQTVTVSAVLRMIRRGTRETPIDLSVWLVPEGRDEKIQAIQDIQNVFNHDDADILFLVISWPPLPPGRYVFHLLAEDSASGVRAETTSKLAVRSN